MRDDQSRDTEPDTALQQPAANVRELLRTAAFHAWAQRRADWQDCSITLFNRAYLGHYSHIDHYVETMVDDYELDAKLDAAIIEPFRAFIDIDVTALARSLVRHGSLYAVPATPVGVWVFNGDVE